MLTVKITLSRGEQFELSFLPIKEVNKIKVNDSALGLSTYVPLVEIARTMGSSGQ